MSTTCADESAEGSAVPEESPGRATRRLDPVDQPPRPLGAKRSALLAQRRGRTSACTHGGRTGSVLGHDGKVLSSASASLAFALLPTRAGLLVERRHCPSEGPRSAQTMVFRDIAMFDRWCDAEPLRFSDPMLHDQLRREGHEALGGST